MGGTREYWRKVDMYRSDCYTLYKYTYLPNYKIIKKT